MSPQKYTFGPKCSKNSPKNMRIEAKKTGRSGYLNATFFSLASCNVLNQLHYDVITLYIYMQCPKLRVYPAPGVHISAAGCTIFRGVHPECARFLSYLLLLHIGRVHGENSGRTVSGGVHPVGAQSKTLISDTDIVAINGYTSAH